MSRPGVMTTKQQIVAAAIEKIYGPITSVEFPNPDNRDMKIIAEFWGDSYSGYNITVTIDKFGRIK